MTISGAPSRQSPAVPHGTPVRFAMPTMTLMFAMFVFGVLTVYAILNPDRSNPVFSDKRILATLAGAGVYWLTIRAIAHRFGRSSREILVSTLVIGVSGALSIFALRTLYDIIMLDDLAGSFERNIRWVMIWLGYFAAWVAGFFAFVCHRNLAAAQTASAPASPLASAATPPDNAAIEAVLAVVVAEIARQPLCDRAALSAALARHAGYEQVDTDLEGTANNARVDLTRRIAARLAQ